MYLFLLSINFPSLMGFFYNRANVVGASELMILFLALIILLTKIRDFNNIIAALFTRLDVIVFIIYTLISVFWSFNSKNTAKNFLYLLIILLSAIVLSLEKLRFKNILYWLIVVNTVLSYLAVFFLPDYGIQVLLHTKGWKGIFLHKNILGVFSLFSIVFLTTFVEENEKFKEIIRNVLILLNIILLYFSNSITAMVALVLILIINIIAKVLKFISKIREKAFKLFLNYFIVLLGVITTLKFSTQIQVVYEKILTTFHRDMSLTGRIYIWDYSIYLIRQRLLFGYGGNATWGEGGLMRLIGSSLLNVPQAHNLFIGILLDYGLIGLILFTINILLTFYHSYRCRNKFVVNFLIMFLIIGIGEDLFYSKLSLWKLLLLTYYFVKDVSTNSKNMFIK